jgi:peptide chain release factor 3
MDSATQEVDALLAREIERRRTFAIISHPDAGKTTLTEKLLLYGGAIETAGAVRGRKSGKRTTSDWMAIEQSRGISVTSSAIQFEYQGYCLNLLDTPGHQDFSEDTYRTLYACDSAVMVLDAAKGIEPQTRKLFHVCSLRGIPILAFINKLDHPGKDPLVLLAEIEEELGVTAVAMNWPIGSGPAFQGVFDLRSRQVLRFERTAHGESPAPVTVAGIEDPMLAELIGEEAQVQLKESVEILEVAGAPFDRGRFLRGNLVPVYFGSALNNFGVEPFLQALLELAPPPAAHQSSVGEVLPEDAGFSGFVFKIQANMDPRHRDRLAFLRVCSGRFEKDMEVFHVRLGRNIRMTRPHRLFARERETLSSAYPGDVIGFVNPGLFRIGDTLSESRRVEFEPIPRFPPEHFAVLGLNATTRQKQFLKGIHQLEEEGLIQLFYAAEGRRSEPLIGVVGELQFDLLRSRLETEYGVETIIRSLPHRFARWLTGPPAAVSHVRGPGQSRLVEDAAGRPAVLFTALWELEMCRKESPEVEFREEAETGQGR